MRVYVSIYTALSRIVYEESRSFTLHVKKLILLA